MSEQGRIEEDLARTRSRMSSRLDDLQDRLTPDRIIDDVVDYVKGSEGGEFARNLMAGAKRNPVPTAIAGIGLAWLMVANSRDRGVGESTASDTSRSKPWTSLHEFDDHVGRIDCSVLRIDGEDDATYTDRLHDARGKALGVARGVQDTATTYAAKLSDSVRSTREGLSNRVDGAIESASAFGQNIGDRASELQRGAREGARQAGDRLTQGGRAVRDTGGDMLSSVLENPVMLGAIGLGVGALLGALLPQPEAEKNALGGVATQARTALRDVAQEAVDRGGAVAQQTPAAGRASADARRLSGAAALGALANDARSGRLSGHVAGVAKDVLGAADDAIRQEKKSTLRGL